MYSGIRSERGQGRPKRWLRCASCPARYRGICGALDNRTLEEFEKISRRKFCHDGDVIFTEGEEAASFFSVVFGVVKLSRCLADGRQHIVELLHAPGFIGPRLSSQHAFSAQAVSDVELCYYPRAAFEHFARRHGELERKISEMTLRELDQCRQRTLILARKNSMERVASFLIMAMERFPDVVRARSDGRALTVRLPLSRTEMADFLGLTLETVSRQFSELRKLHIIAPQSSKEVLVCDVGRLAEIASIEAAPVRHEAGSCKPSPAQAAKPFVFG